MNFIKRILTRLSNNQNNIQQIQNTQPQPQIIYQLQTYETETDDDSSSLDYNYHTNPKIKKILYNFPQSNYLKNGITLKGYEKTDIQFPDELKDLLIDLFKEVGIVKIISDYSSKFYECCYCKKKVEETNVIFYNMGNNKIITECSDCST